MSLSPTSTTTDLETFLRDAINSFADGQRGRVILFHRVTQRLTAQAIVNDMNDDGEDDDEGAIVTPPPVPTVSTCDYCGGQTVRPLLDGLFCTVSCRRSARVDITYRDQLSLAQQ